MVEVLINKHLEEHQLQMEVQEEELLEEQQQVKQEEWVTHLQLIQHKELLEALIVLLVQITLQAEEVEQ